MTHTDVCFFFFTRAFCFRVNNIMWLISYLIPVPGSSWYTYHIMWDRWRTSSRWFRIKYLAVPFPRLPCPSRKRHLMLNLTSTGVCNTGTSALQLYVCNLLLWLTTSKTATYVVVLYLEKWWKKLDTYTKFSFSFSVGWDIPTSALFHPRAFCFRVNRLFHNWMRY